MSLRPTRQHAKTVEINRPIWAAAAATARKNKFRTIGLCFVSLLMKVRELKHRVRTSDERHAKRTSGLEVKLIKAIGENLALHEK